MVVIIVGVVVVVAGGAKRFVKDVMDFDDKVGDTSWNGRVVEGHGDRTAGLRHFSYVYRKSAARSTVLTGRDLL